MQLSITARTAKGILKERSIPLDKLKREGRVDLTSAVRLTFKHPCCYTLVDLSSAGGEGIAELVEREDRPLLPALHSDADGNTHTERIRGQEQDQRGFAEQQKQKHLRDWLRKGGK